MKITKQKLLEMVQEEISFLKEADRRRGVLPEPYTGPERRAAVVNPNQPVDPNPWAVSDAPTYNPNPKEITKPLSQKTKEFLAKSKAEQDLLPRRIPIEVMNILLAALRAAKDHFSKREYAAALEKLNGIEETLDSYMPKEEENPGQM